MIYLKPVIDSIRDMNINIHYIMCCKSFLAIEKKEIHWPVFQKYSKYIFIIDSHVVSRNWKPTGPLVITSDSAILPHNSSPWVDPGSS